MSTTTIPTTTPGGTRDPLKTAQRQLRRLLHWTDWRRLEASKARQAGR